MSEENFICAVCQKVTSLKCARCRRVGYCSKEHQKVDWKVHKKNCELTISECFMIAEDQNVGRHLISTRYISEGETVLAEAPIVAGPMESTPPVCLGCYKLLNKLNSQNCSRCNWPVCSAACANSDTHKPECEITTKYKKEKVAIRTFGANHPSYQCITVLRCLYLSKLNKVAWEKITKLESHSEERKNSERYSNDVKVAEFIPRFFNFREFTEEEILKIIGIVQVNAHHVLFEKPGFIAIYDKGSMIEHNCSANCSRSFSEDGKIVVRAARAIQKGEHLSISYTEPLWGKQVRQDFLFMTKYFLCKCERCSDPTELGTNFNSMKCISSDCNGYVVPHNAGSSVPEYHWRCKACGRNYHSDNDFSKLTGKATIGISKLDHTNPESCKEFLNIYGKYLHQNHHLIAYVKSSFLQHYDGENVHSASDEDLNLIISFCEHLIDLTSRLVPAENRLRGFLHYSLYLALAELGRRKSLSQQMDNSEINQNLMMYRNVLKKAYSFLKTESEKLLEGKMAVEVLKYIHNIDEIMGGTKLF